MIPNDDKTLYAELEPNDNNRTYARIVAWDDNGAPMVVGWRGLTPAVRLGYLGVQCLSVSDIEKYSVTPGGQRVSKPNTEPTGQETPHQLRPLSDLPEPKRWKAHKYDVIDAARDVLPDEWRVLPTGGSTAKAIARRAAERYEARELGKTAHPARRRVRAIPSSAIPKRSPRTATTADDADKSEKEKCAEFLLDYLSRTESLDAKREDIFKAARGALYSEGTIKRAKTFAGIWHSRTNEPQPKTVWHHPDSETPKRSLHPATDAAYRASVGDAR